MLEKQCYIITAAVPIKTGTKDLPYFFWRWGVPTMAMEGIIPYIITELPTSQGRARVKLKDKHLIFEKIVKYINKGYLTICDHDQVKNYIDYFYVLKGLIDIRLVFNRSSCGLNDATWLSKFWLPMAGTLVRLLHFNYAVVDIDLGEIFLNFPIHESLQESVSIDLTPFGK